MNELTYTNLKCCSGKSALRKKIELFSRNTSFRNMGNMQMKIQNLDRKGKTGSKTPLYYISTIR